jgi:hypothetical protein
MDKQYNPEGFIPKHGGYERLITYQKSQIIYDGTNYFFKKIFQEKGCHRIEVRRKQK